MWAPTFVSLTVKEILDVSLNGLHDNAVCFSNAIQNECNVLEPLVVCCV